MLQLLQFQEEADSPAKAPAAVSRFLPLLQATHNRLLLNRLKCWQQSTQRTLTRLLQPPPLLPPPPPLSKVKANKEQVVVLTCLEEEVTSGAVVEQRDEAEP